MAQRLAAEPGLHIMNPVVLNPVLVRFGSAEIDAASDRMTAETIALIQSDGTCFVAGTSWQDRRVMRLSLVSGSMNEPGSDRPCDAICAARRKVRGQDGGRHR